jgi:Lrp/AsnC family transcriptional regulator, leucine-responsive regulatory protein
MRMDDIDIKLIGLLQRDARLSNAQLAEAVGLTISSVHERVKKLERKGVITGYVARVDAERLGKGLLSFMRLSFSTMPHESIDDVRARLAALCDKEQDILECHGVAGEECFILKLRAASPRALEDLIAKVRGCAQSTRSVTNIVLSTYKESIAVEPASDARAEEE